MVPQNFEFLLILSSLLNNIVGLPAFADHGFRKVQTQIVR